MTSHSTCLPPPPHTHTGSDYTAVSDIDVTFDPNETVQTVFVTILNDEILENDENFAGRLSLPGGATGIMIGQSVSTATIQDEDGEFYTLEK